MQDQLEQQPRILQNPIEAMFAGMNRQERRKFMDEQHRQRTKLPKHMVMDELPQDMLEEGKVLGAWKSRDFSAVAWKIEQPGVVCRLSVNRMDLDPNTGSFLAGITWDQLYQIKNQCGFAGNDAVEVYPAADKLVNVSNMRHLWVLEHRLRFSL